VSPRRRDAPGPAAPEVLAESLRAEILSGNLLAGTPLREEELARAHGVSRHTVRAGLARLTSERLLETRPHHGARVRTFDERDAIALQQLRGALEAEAVRLTRERFGGAWTREAREPVVLAIKELATAELGDDWLTVTRAHAAVHQAIVAAAASDRITEAYDRLNSETLLLLTQVRPHYPRGSLAPDHRRYFTSVQEGSIEAVHQHLERTSAFVLEGSNASGDLATNGQDRN